MIRLSLTRADASVTETETLTAGRVGLECAFTFNADWDGLEKVAVFEGAETIEVALGTANVAVVPPECMATAGYNLRCGAYGMSATQAIVIPTVWAKAGKIKDSAAPDESLADFTPTLAAQVIAKADSAEETANTIAERASRGEFDGFSPYVGVTEIENGHRVSITDSVGTNEFNVMDGADGADGYSPVVTITDIEGGHRVTITDEAHPQGQSFDVMDGEGGGSTITVDSALSSTSENPVQNKVINTALNSKGTYSKPIGGIPKTDLASAVQTSLDKADAALQSVPSTYRTAAAQDTVDAGKIDKNQGAANAGKFMVVDSNGLVIPSATSEAAIQSAVDDWLDENRGSIDGISFAIKNALLACFQNVAWINENGQTYYDALHDALFPPVDLDSISAVFNQGSAVIYDTDALDSLKQRLTVTATYSDSSTATVPSADYTLSGTLAEGTSVVTVSYGGKSTTFNVTVSHYDTGWVSGVPYDMTDGLTENMYLSNGTETAYNGWAISPYLRVSGAFFVSNTTFNTQYCAEYDGSGNYLRKPNIVSGFYVGLNDYGDVASIRVSESASAVTNAVITPYRLDGLTDSTVIDTSKYYTPADWSNIGYIDSNTGAFVADNSYKCSDYMNCYNMTTITDNLWQVYRGYGFYDGDKNFISSATIATADQTKGKQTSIPSGARYFRAYKLIEAPDLCFNLS